jgi:transcriptional regulator with GAF, ATPase, and Fis domain
MGDVTTLVCGPSGTGKELVARAIGFSRYIPFDPKAGAFADDFAGSFHPLNLSALSPTLIESELFGHRKGSFTGAVADRAGWLEVCRPHGTIFLDEIGDVDPAIQVKLLRVLQTRAFQRIGETAPRAFRGKIVAATNRDLAREMRAGRFREDLYYRLCADLLVTPSLREQLEASPGELRPILRFIARRLVGTGTEAETVAAEAEVWIEKHLGRDYPWPGNVRELEQCVSNVLIRKAYIPTRPPTVDPRDALARDAAAGTLTADELLRRYCTLVYAQAGSWQEAARRLDLDHRTVKDKVDPKGLDAFRA